MKNTKLKHNTNHVGVAVLGDPQKNTKFIANPVGAGLVPAKNEKGITLIALIITIIVMLILVGVTINVALNGGLFSKAKQGSFQTEASMVREQLEIAKAVEIANKGGKPLDNYSIITIDNTDLDNKTKDKYRDKIIVNPDGDVCYDPTKITDGQEQDWLEAIGIKPYVKPTLKTEYTFTIGELVQRGLLGTDRNG